MQAVDRARRGEGPTLIEAETYRIKGHYVGDHDQMYRDKSEVELYWQKEPIGRFEKKLVEMSLLTDSEKHKVWDEIEKEIDGIVKFARQGAWPPVESALEDLFADAAGCID